MLFDLNADLNAYYRDHVRISSDERSKLGRYRDACLDRLHEGIERLAWERRTRSHSFVDAVPQGSYPMYTLNKHALDEYDIDVAVIFNEEDLPPTPSQARHWVADALLATRGNFRRAPAARTNAVTVWYADGPHVDLAVYRQIFTPYGSTLEHAGPRWGERAPDAVTAWFNTQVEARSPAGFAGVDDKQLRRIVRWVKAFARSRVTWDLPGGMILTTLATNCYAPDPTRDDVALFRTLVSMHHYLRHGLEVRNPVDPRLSLTSKQSVAIQMQELYRALDSWLPHLAVLQYPFCSQAQARHAWSKFFNHWL